MGPLLGPDDFTLNLAAYINGDIEAVRPSSPHPPAGNNKSTHTSQDECDISFNGDDESTDFPVLHSTPKMQATTRSTEMSSALESVISPGRMASTRSQDDESLLERLRALETTLAEQEAQLEAKDTKIRVVESALAEKEAQLRAKDAKFQEQEEEVREKIRTIQRLETTQKTHEEEIDKKNATIRGRDDIHHSQKVKLSEKDSAIERLEAVRTNQEKEIKNLQVLNTQVLLENDKVREDQEALRRSHADAEKRCHSLKATLKAVYEIDMEGRNMQREIQTLRATLEESEKFNRERQDEIQLLVDEVKALRADRTTLSRALMQEWGEKEHGKTGPKQRYTYKYVKKPRVPSAV